MVLEDALSRKTRRVWMFNVVMKDKMGFLLLSVGLVLAGMGMAACSSSDTVGGSDEVCVPSCLGLSCGDDGCGGVCGYCTAEYVCDLNQCKMPCASGLCQVNETCVGDVCIPNCVPDCANKNCGDDGCGGD